MFALASVLAVFASLVPFEASTQSASSSAPAPAVGGLAARFDSRGIEVEIPTSSSTPSSARTLRVETTAFGRVGRADALRAGELREGPTRTEIARTALTEWFERVPAGIEHGWTIASAPEASTDDADLWIGVTFRGLAPQISEGTHFASLVDEHGVQQLSYRELRAWDASGRELDARMDTIGTQFGIRVDDADAQYPVTVDPILGTADFFFHPSQAGARMFLSSTAGDVDGDGFSDLLVSADLWNEGSLSDAGRVWIFRGSANGLVMVPWWQSSGPAGGQLGGQYGSTVATLGDIDADGFDDFAVGAQDWDSTVNGTDTGAVFVYRGGATAPTLHWTLEGSAPFTYLEGPGRYVGDLNGDGRDDLVTVTVGGGPLEYVTLYLGSAAAMPPAPAATLTKSSLGLDVNADAVFHVGAAGDVNSDGFEDLLIGASSSFSGQGRAMLCLGAIGGLVTTPVWSARPPGAPGVSYYGLHVGSAGDIDANGYPDVFVSAYLHPGDLTGAVYVYMANPSLHGSQILPSFNDPSVVTLLGTGPDAKFGIGCDTAGDFDADGFADLVVGMPANSGVPGTALIFRGSANGLIQASTWQGSEPGILYGTRCASAGDVNGDGRTDVAVTAIGYSDGGAFPNEGAVFVHHGRATDSVVGTIQTGQASLTGPPTTGFGSTLATGDVNGDGLQDVLVGSPTLTAGESEEGRVALYLGHATAGFSGAASWTFDSQSVGAHLGAAVSICGDVDNDGFDDVLVGAPNWTNGQNDEGRVWLFRGTASGNLGFTAAWTMESNVVGQRFGASLAGAGDCDGDGLGDVIIGSPGTYLSDALRGHARVFYGRPFAVLDLFDSTVLDGPQPGAQFAFSVAGADDLNRDGYSDVLVGSPDWTNVESLEGRAYAFLGGPQGVSTTPNWVYEANVAGARFGTSISTAGDVNRDGQADAIVGAPGFTSGAILGGSAFLFLAQPGVPSLPSSPSSSLGEPQPGAKQGGSVTFAGDVNSDGFSDVMIGAPDFDAASGTIPNAGRVQLHLGASTGLLPAAWTREGTSTNGRLGTWCAGGADFDGDGFSDLAFGIPGNTEIYVNPGGSGQSAYFGTDQRRLDDTRAIGLLGHSEQSTDFRMQGTSFNANSISSTVLGREDYRLEFENKLLSGTLDGTGLDQSPLFVDSGTVTGTPPPPIRTPVGGLSGGNAYQWRMRIQHRNPLVPHTRWLYVQGNGARGKKLGTAPDCNGNGIPDANEIFGNDCNGDQILDACQVPPICPACPDCNGNGAPDACELDFGNDCDFNGIPDDCQADCDNDLQADACQIIGNPSLDSNIDGVLDSCQTAVSIFCPGDGSGTACPCANHSVPADADGCLNSLGFGGRLRWSGVPRVSADNFTLLGSKMPNSSALYFQGTLQQSGGAGAVFGDGKRCAGGSTTRLGTKTNAGNASQYPVFGDTSISVRGSIPLGGATRTYQVWYRNAAAFCSVSTFNLTNGLSAVWVP